MYTIWSALMLPLRIAISESSVIVAFIKAVRIYLFIGDGQLWYMNALIVGLILIVILRKLKVPDYGVALISVVLFIIGIFIIVIPPIVISAIFQSKSALRPAPTKITSDAIT